MTNPPPPLPQNWDLTSYFPAFGGPEYGKFKYDLRAELAAALERAAALSPLAPEGNAAGTGAPLEDWAGIFGAYEDLSARVAHLGSYLGCLGAADAASEVYQAETAALAREEAELQKLRTQLLRGLRSADDALIARLLAVPALAGAEFAVRRLRAESGYQMEAEQEALVADLGVDGFSAWGRLYDTLSGKMTFEMTFPDGRRATVPMAQRHSLLANPDRNIRREAFVEANRVWAAAADTCAAALNALAGTRHTLYARRGRKHFLDTPLHDAAVGRGTIEAMFAAIAEQYELPRRLLRLGARLQGTPAVAWYDLNAPRPLDAAPVFTFDEGVALVQSAFDAAYPKLGDYFRGVVARRWIEAEKRGNKRGGAFQTSSPVSREERIFMTFAGTMNDVVTLAHEAGHAWHTHVLTRQRPCARQYPMTLAETASTFAEKILVQGLLADPGLTPSRRAFLLDLETNHMPAYLLNIPTRFQFECRFYEERRGGVVSPTRLCEMMTAAQREVYGDALERGGEDPWFWASKLHFFITDVSFYNFPYTFGFLLSQALAAEFRRAGADFLERYERFLGVTGSATCEDAVRTTLGWDLRDREFWTRAILAGEEPVRAFEEVVAQRLSGQVS